MILQVIQPTSVLGSTLVSMNWHSPLASIAPDLSKHGDAASKDAGLI